MLTYLLYLDLKKTLFILEIKNCDLVCDAMGKGFFHNFGAIQDGAFCELRSGKEGFCIKGNCMVSFI